MYCYCVILKLHSQRLQKEIFKENYLCSAIVVLNALLVAEMVNDSFEITPPPWGKMASF